MNAHVSAAVTSQTKSQETDKSDVCVSVSWDFVFKGAAADTCALNRFLVVMRLMQEIREIWEMREIRGIREIREIWE